jgi:hypothetical protein
MDSRRERWQRAIFGKDWFFNGNLQTQSSCLPFVKVNLRQL